MFNVAAHKTNILDVFTIRMDYVQQEIYIFLYPTYRSPVHNRASNLQYLRPMSQLPMMHQPNALIGLLVKSHHLAKCEYLLKLETTRLLLECSSIFCDFALPSHRLRLQRKRIIIYAARQGPVAAPVTILDCQLLCQQHFVQMYRPSLHRTHKLIEFSNVNILSSEQIFRNPLLFQ